MSRPVLVDSCWYIRMTRQSQEPPRALSFLAESRDIATCGIVMDEVGRGIKNPAHLEAYQSAWSVMQQVPSSHQRWQETMKLARSLDRQGIILPPPESSHRGSEP